MTLEEFLGGGGQMTSTERMIADGLSKVGNFARNLDPSGLVGQGLDFLGGEGGSSLVRRGLPAAAGFAVGGPVGGIVGAQVGRAWDSHATTGDPMAGLGAGPLAADVAYTMLPGIAGGAGYITRALAPIRGAALSVPVRAATGVAVGRLGNALEGVEPSIFGDLAAGAGGLSGRLGKIDPFPDPEVRIPGTGGGRAGGLTFGELFETSPQSYDSDPHVRYGRTAAERRLPPATPQETPWNPQQVSAAREAIHGAQAIDPEAAGPAWARAVVEGTDNLEPAAQSAIGLRDLPAAVEEQPRLAIRNADGVVAQMKFPEPPKAPVDAVGADRLVAPGVRRAFFRQPSAALRTSPEPEARLIGRVLEEDAQAANRIEGRMVNRLLNVRRDAGARGFARGYGLAEVPDYRQMRLFDEGHNARIQNPADLRTADRIRRIYDEVRDLAGGADVPIYRDGEFSAFGEGRNWYVPHLFKSDVPGSRLRDYFDRSEPQSGPLSAFRSRTQENIGGRLKPLPEAMAAAHRDARLISNSVYLGPAYPGEVPKRFGAMIKGMKATAPGDAALARESLIQAAHGPSAGSSTAAIAWSRLAKRGASSAMLSYSMPSQLAQIANTAVEAGPINTWRGLQRFKNDEAFRNATLASGSSDVSMYGEGALNNIPGALIQGAEKFNRTAGVAGMVEKMEQIGRRARDGRVTAAMRESSAKLGYTPTDLASRLNDQGQLGPWDIQRIAERGSERVHFTQRPGTASPGMMTPFGSTFWQYKGFPLRQAAWTLDQTVRPAALAVRDFARGNYVDSASMAGEALKKTALVASLVPLAQAGGKVGAAIMANRPLTPQTIMEQSDPTGGLGQQALRIGAALQSNDPSAWKVRAAEAVLPPVTSPFATALRRAKQGRGRDAVLGLAPLADPTGISAYFIRPEMAKRDRIYRAFHQ